MINGYGSSSATIPPHVFTKSDPGFIPVPDVTPDLWKAVFINTNLLRGKTVDDAGHKEPAPMEVSVHFSSHCCSYVRERPLVHVSCAANATTPVEITQKKCNQGCMISSDPLNLHWIQLQSLMRQADFSLPCDEILDHVTFFIHCIES